MDQFELIEPDLRLRHRVVVCVADGFDRRIDAFIDQPVGEGYGRINRIAPGLVEGAFSRQRLLSGSDLTVVRVLHLDRCEIPDRGVQAKITTQKTSSF